MPANHTAQEKGRTSAAIVGAGFAGLAASAVLASNAVKVDVFEKNSTIGGRARRWESNGFLFDMGPSWYWMPDVYEKFYNRFGHTAADFYELKKLDPGFKIIFGKDDELDIPENFDELCALFEKIEEGSAAHLKKFMDHAETIYHVGMDDLVYKPSHSINEFFSYDILRKAVKLRLFSSFSKYVRSHFKNPKLITLLEFPVLFLGAMPKDTPALYSLMNYAGLKVGTFYPMGGFGKVVDAFEKIAKEQGVTIHTSQNVQKLEISSNRKMNVMSNDKSSDFDGVIASADYHHVEQSLLAKKDRMYDEKYWNKKTFAPSCLIYYLGISKKVNKLVHHNLFFDGDFEMHSKEIYKDQQWPLDPLFYVCCTSKTDDTTAPEGCENLFLLMPVAPGLKDSDDKNEFYYNLMMTRVESFVGEEIRSHVVVKKSYSVSDFISDYNAYKGNAYGLANTLLQTAMFKPKMRSKKINNLFFAGQLTVPGPGVPPSIISGQVAAGELLKFFKIKSR